MPLMVPPFQTPFAVVLDLLAFEQRASSNHTLLWERALCDGAPMGECTGKALAQK